MNPDTRVSSRTGRYMQKTSLIPVFVLLCFLLLAFGCKREAPRMPPPAEDQATQTASAKHTTLEGAIQLYENSSNPLDAEECVKIFNAYAYSNDPEAQYYLGLARAEGKGADQSDLEAYVWWTIAARQHHLNSMNRIENVQARFTEDELAEINNRANDWEEKIRNTPEAQ